ncbi:WD40 repeat-like protein [Serendipita vermifera]|nr:WD40 repeat-like protein [Serendipita vermifera]
MLVKTLEIGWHEAKPIYSCDFQRRTTRTSSGTVAHKFATAGADTFVRLWLIHPVDPNPDSKAAEKGPKAEYLSTLAKHAGAVNVVRWSPNGDLLASAADDGMLIIWTKDEKGQGSVWGRDTKDAALDKETWKVANAIRVTSGEVYDLAWSPTAEYILTGSTDNTARIFSISDNVCVREIADHSHYVQGVAWDPMNEFIATQSSDRSVKLYTLSTKHGSLETHPVGSNSKMVIRRSRGHSRNNSTTNRGGKGGNSGNGSHSRAPSQTRQTQTPVGLNQPSRGRTHNRRSSISSETSNVSMVTGYSTSIRDSRDPISTSTSNPTSATTNMDAPLTPATSVASGYGGMFLPPSATSTYSGASVPRDSSVTPIKEGRSTNLSEYREPRTTTTSRRSSFSGSQAPGSPASFRGRGLVDDRDARSNYGRSPSPMPPLPAIRTPHPGDNPGHAGSWTATRLYGDENMTTFFRRLTFSPDGNLLFTPAGWFEDNSVSVSAAAARDEDTTLLGDKETPKERTTSSCVYVYSKANFSKSPIAAYPGHKRAVVGVKFSNILYDLRDNLSSSENTAVNNPVTITLEPGKEDIVDNADLVSDASESKDRLSSTAGSKNGISLPSPAMTADSLATPAQTPQQLPGETPAGVPVPEGSPQEPVSVYNLPYRMLFAVATQDTVTIHDTQQAGPVCLLTKLHYDSFTDMAWSHDGQILMLVSSDGYCTVVHFDENIPHHSTQQRDLQLKSVALSHSHGLINTAVSHIVQNNPISTPTHQPHATPSSAHSASGNSHGPQSPLVHPTPSPFIPPLAPSPANASKDLVSSLGQAGSATGPNTLKRSASTFDPPLTPAASVSGMEGDTNIPGGVAGASEGERADEGPAKKRRRVELKHHGAAV